MAKLKKSASIAKDEFKSQKFDELTQGRNFTASDIPTLAMLCHWHQIAQQCIDDMQTQDGIQVAYMNKLDDLKALPQIAVLKQASAEIRALNKQLGINDQAQNQDKKKTKKASLLTLVVKDRAKKSGGA